MRARRGGAADSLTAARPRRSSRLDVQAGRLEPPAGHLRHQFARGAQAVDEDADESLEELHGRPRVHLDQPFQMLAVQGERG